VAQTPLEESNEFIEKKQKPRYYYIDWVRTIAIHYVAWIHCNSIADEVMINHLRNETIEMTEDDFWHYTSRRAGQVRVMVQFGIPAFFYMSGFASTFFNTSKKSFCTYFKERFLRLLVPFILACIFLLTPRMYLS
jgi:fucose 4-O-acetylase-like acetyltransferase